MKNWQQQQRKQLENVTLENQHFRFGAVHAVTMSTQDSNWAVEVNQEKPLTSTA